MIQSTKDYGYLAFRILQTAFILALILNGLSEILQIREPLSTPLPLLACLIKNNERVFFVSLAGIEIFLGVGLIFKPWIFAYLLSGFFFLLLATLTLIKIHPSYFLGCFCLMLASFALGKLSQKYMPE